MTKKYTLKPGLHQFAPGSHPVHQNDDLTDEEAEWYMERYPHIEALFEGSPGDRESESPETTISEIPTGIGAITATISEIPTQ
jgi:hypothetical protein